MKRWQRGLWVVTVASAGACSFNSQGDGTDDLPVVDAQRIADSSLTFDSAPAFDAAQPSPFAAWNRRTHLRLGTANVPESLAAFPALVRLQAPAVALDNVQNGGNDLRFVTFDGEQLSYDVERISNVELIAWVSIPLPAGGEPRLDVWMYYDNPAALAGANSAAVWTGQTSVHHLSDSFNDATGGGHAGTVATAETTPTSVPGAAGEAMYFDGDDLVTVAGEVDFDFTTTMTASLWMKASFPTPTEWNAMLGKGRSWRMNRNGSTDTASFTINNNGDDLLCDTVVFDEQWHHLTAVHLEGSRNLYVDGVLCNSKLSVASLVNDEPVTMGNRLGSSMERRYYQGVLDEVRISATAATSARLRADYLTVADPNFVTVVVDEENL